jgi:hypothetical protein
MPDDTRPALRYLAASGAGAISVTADVDGVAIVTGYDAGDETIVETLWCPREKARSVAARARHIAGENPDVDTAIAAVRAAAAKDRVVLTLHDVAMQRAADNAAALDAYLEQMRKSGGLAEFNRMFKAARLAAASRGEHYMSFANAELRLRRTLIPALVTGRIEDARGLFAMVFETACRT